ncbi:MAG TPA: redoxin domain-containing protein [Chthoniobacteraceae bacterium]|nr:redoxin domain-containing protein [Chthoniobacteraceae bacterium]
MNRLTVFSLLALGAFARAEDASSAKPEDKPLPGHSLNGETFNEGPRQAAVLMQGTGNVHLAVTTKNELAQKFFDQGLGQLHGFWYFEAERSFRQAAALDPECAMAYWGMTMANINNPERASGFIKEAVKRKEKAARQEQLYIGAWADYYAEKKKDEKERREALVRGLEDLVSEFPDDLEARSFLVFQLWDNKGHDVPMGSRKAVEALAKQVLAANPMHPGAHHYLIHLWNANAGDKRALPSAALGGQAGPGIAHLWHMPGHTFSALRRYADAAWQQEASARVDHAYMIATRIMPDQIHNFAHNNDWLVKNLGYIGRAHDAIDLAKNMIELPRLGSKSRLSYKLGRERLLATLVEYEMWDELAKLDGTLYLASYDEPLDELRRLKALGVAWFETGDLARGEEKLSALKSSLAKAREERIKAADEAEVKAKKESKPDDQIAKAMADAMRTFASKIATAESAIAEIELTRALLDRDLETARTKLELVKDLSSERRAYIQLALGANDKAEQLARDLVKADDVQVVPLAVLADVLWRIGKKEDALATFKKLRALSAQLDLDTPPFKRLAPLAQESGLPADWRIASEVPPDVGQRPDLATLGPFRWHPYEAPDWSLSDQHGKQVSLADYKGRPVLVVFYLGSGCAGCMEQLNVFAPKVKAFEEAGVQVVAVSTDSADGLHKTFEKAKEGEAFKFPILSDASLATFKAYRAYDDFEHIPLHGTFLIDGTGHVRWQDISYQPYKDADWLLGETKRLLSVPVATATTASLRAGPASR